MAKDAIKVVGKVIKVHNNDEFDVELENGHVIKAHISGKMRFHHIAIIRDDVVDVEISTYDMTNGRIVFRHK